MLSQRILQQSARRLATQQPLALHGSFAPALALISRRTAASVSSPSATKVSQDDSLKILANQRLHRPVAPHLSIYQPQITWYPSMFNRITGVALSGSLYLFSLTYLAAPLFGWQITTAALAAGFAKWPIVLKLAAKTIAALPFTFHSLNGLRHLVWDLGLTITNKQVAQTGWTVVGLSVVSALGFAFFV